MKVSSMCLALSLAAVLAGLGFRPAWSEAPTPFSQVRNLVVNAVRGSSWAVIRCDEQPTVNVAARHGYRILLRHGERELVGPPQQGPFTREERERLPFVMRYSHVDLVVFPSEGPVPADLKTRIPWLDVEQQHFVTPVYMGTRMGYDWFARTTIFDQHGLRQTLRLQGGDDPLRLLADGLGVADKGTATRNSVIPMLKAAGERAIPYIEAAIKQQADPWYAAVALGSIPGSRATEILRAMYASPNRKLSSAAAYALISKPYRESAKSEYFDMLRRREGVEQVSRACIQFGWKDALPILRDVCAKPRHWRDFRAAFEARRQLVGNPVPNELKKAEQVILATARRPEEAPTPSAVKQAKQAILNCADREAAAVVAVSLAVQGLKAYTRLPNTIGEDLLHHLPAKAMPWLPRVAASVQDQNDRAKLAALLR